MTFVQLRYILTIAETKSMNKAAELLYVSQPSLTNAVKELENRRGMFEHRVQYYNLDVNTREEIIRFIFEEERKSRKKERLN